MSISIVINNPVTEDESKFYIPVSTETFFDECWRPGCEALNLKWIPAFSYGVDIEKENLSEVKSELTKLRDWASKYLSDEKKIHLVKRLDLLSERISQLFTRDDVSIFIG
jgi:hypothetical protein